MPSKELENFCRAPSIQSYLILSKTEKHQFYDIAKIVVQKKFKLEKHQKILAASVIEYFSIFNNCVKGEEAATEVTELMKVKLKTMSKSKQKNTLIALRMYTFCFDSIINEMLNQHYKGNKVSTLPILNCIHDGDYFGRDSFTLEDFGKYYTELCESLQYPVELIESYSNNSNEKIVQTYVKAAKSAYSSILNASIILPKTVRLYRGVRIKKGSTTFDYMNYINNSLSSCTYNFEQACRFATNYFPSGTTLNDYDLYVYDIYFPPGTKMISPSICALQNEWEILICDRYTCETVAITPFDYKSPYGYGPYPIKVIKCFATVTPLVKKITNKIILHDSEKGRWKSAFG